MKSFLLRPLLIFSLLCLWCYPFKALSNPETQNNYTLQVTGLERQLESNVLAKLSLRRYQTADIFSEQHLDALIAEAPAEIKTALQPFGFYNPAISIATEQESGELAVEISVDRGEPVLVKTVQIDCSGAGCGNESFKEVFAKFPLKPGDILDHRKYSQGKQALISTMLDFGYQRANFSRAAVEVSIQKNSADILLTLDIGAQYFLGAITFDCDFLNKSLLHRASSFKEGDPFSPRYMTRMRQEMMATGYFESVEFKFDLNEADEAGKVPLLVILKPGKANRFGAGVGYGTDTGIRGSLKWFNRRINKSGHQLDIQLQPSERKSYYGGVYTIPIKDPRTQRISLSGKLEKEDFENTETEGLSTTISYDHLLQNGEYSIYLRYLDEDFTTGLDNGHANLLTPGIQATWRWADNRISATNGISFTLDCTGSSDEVLSDTTFIQGALSGKVIVSFLNNWRFIGHSQLGATAVDSFKNLPPSLRFYAGGDSSVRGYKYKSIGPKDAAGNVIGGQYLFTYNLELERRLFGRWGAALFFDSGTATDSWDNLKMKNGVGAGIRWNGAFGQLRIDIANAISDGNIWRLHFSLGADF